MNKQMLHVRCVRVWSEVSFSLKDSLVGLYFEVSPFLKLVSIFVPAERRTGTPRRLALQVQLVPFDQRLSLHQPELRSRSWTDGEREDTIRTTPVTLHFMAVSVVVHAREKQLKICALGFRWHNNNLWSKGKAEVRNGINSHFITCLFK